MAIYNLCLLAVLVLGAVFSAGAYPYDLKLVESILNEVPPEERAAFLRYALNQGYELAEGKQLQIYSRISHEMYKYLYQYYMDHHLITDVNDLKSTRDIICFPSGCIEVDDPGIHPF